MKDNIVDFQNVSGETWALIQQMLQNDAVYSDKKKTSRFFYLPDTCQIPSGCFPYLVVVIPLGILAGFRSCCSFRR